MDIADIGLEPLIGLLLLESQQFIHSLHTKTSISNVEFNNRTLYYVHKNMWVRKRHCNLDRASRSSLLDLPVIRLQ